MSCGLIGLAHCIYPVLHAKNGLLLAAGTRIRPRGSLWQNYPAPYFVIVMLSLPKHLYQFIVKPFNEPAKMLRRAQHDGCL